MISFIKTRDETNVNDVTEIHVSIHKDLNLDDLFHAFKLFLKGVGYSSEAVDEYLQQSEGEDLD